MHVKYSWKLLLLLQGKIIYMFNIFSNTKKVVRSKQNGSSWQYEVTHWRTETIKKLYERCRIQHPAVKECGINYFAKFIPWFVRTKPKYTGLCWRHDLGKFFTDLLCKRSVRNPSKKPQKKPKSEARKKQDQVKGIQKVSNTTD